MQYVEISNDGLGIGTIKVSTSTLRDGETNREKQGVEFHFENDDKQGQSIYLTKKEAIQFKKALTEELKPIKWTSDDMRGSL